jgi:hypothetical protein
VFKRLYVAAARLYQGAFAARPELATQLLRGYRFHATRAAALASSGHGNDAAALDAAERMHWRRQALDWLREDVAAWARYLKDNPRQAGASVQQVFPQLLRDPALAGLRDAQRLAQLPPAEQEACRQVWAEVQALLRQAGGKDSP